MLKNEFFRIDYAKASLPLPAKTSMINQENFWPLVSILIPAYNHEEYITRCLYSVIYENYPNKEIVIINDGSTDGTHHRIMQWSLKFNDIIRITYFRRTKNRGVSHTLNDLTKMAAGAFFVFLGSDDCLLRNGIMTRFNYLTTHKEKMAVIGDCIVIDENDNLIYGSSLTEFHCANLKNYNCDEGLQREIIWNWSVPGPALMVKRDIYDFIGAYDARLSVEDWDFFLRMVSKNLLGYVNCKVSAYRVHSDSACRSIFKESRIQIELFKTAIKNLKNFRGASMRLLVKKAIVYAYLILKSRLHK